MKTCLSRRQFLGASCLGAGGLLLSPRWTWADSDQSWLPKLKPVKIHQLYVGRTGGIYLSRPTEEIDRFQRYLATVAKRLGNVEFVGGDCIPPTETPEVLDKIKGADAVLMFHLCGHGGDAPTQAMKQVVDAGLPTAVFTQPFSGHGWMYFPRWQQEGKRVVLLPTSDWSEIDSIVALLRVPALLRQTRVLVIRGPLGTQAACSAQSLQDRLGVQMIPVSVEETLQAHQAVNLAEAEAEAERTWLRQAQQIVEPTREEIINATRYYLALKNLMIREQAHAVTSSNCMGEPAKACLAFSKLNDLGLVGACEGDMDSTLTMLMFAYAFGIPGFISDPVVDTSKQALIHFHCTCATRMDGPASERLPFTIRTQTDSDRGVALDVHHRLDQEVTCAKFVNLDTMLLSTGKIFDVTHDELGCRTQFWTRVADAEALFRNWGRGVLGDDTMTLLHRVVFYGNHQAAMEHLGHLMGFKVLMEV